MTNFFICLMHTKFRARSRVCSDPNPTKSVPFKPLSTDKERLSLAINHSLMCLVTSNNRSRLGSDIAKPFHQLYHSLPRNVQSSTVKLHCPFEFSNYK